MGKKTGATRDANKPPYFTDDHDAVLVLIRWRLNKQWDMNTGSKQWQKSGTERRSSAPTDSGAQLASSPVAPSHPKPTRIVSTANTHCLPVLNMNWRWDKLLRRQVIHSARVLLPLRSHVHRWLLNSPAVLYSLRRRLAPQSRSHARTPYHRRHRS